MSKKYWILLAFLTITGVAISQDVTNTFLPKDLMKNNKTLLLKVPYNEEITPYNQEKAPYTNFSGRFEIVESSKSIDIFYPDITIYKYVLVFAGAIKKDDFKKPPIKKLSLMK